MTWLGVPSLLVVIRAVHFAATMILAGTLLFRAAIAGPWLDTGPASLVTDARNLRLAWAALVIAAVSAVIWIVAQASAISGQPLAEVITGDVLWTLVSETQFGLVSGVRLALFVAAGMWLMRAEARQAQWLAAIMALATTALIAWTGHAASSIGELGAFHLAADALHLMAAASWIGGLVPLTLFLAAIRRDHGPSWPQPASAVLQRFSTLGIVSVSVVLVTGIVNAAILVGSLPVLVTTDYGRVLMLKLALFAVMLGFAAANRVWLTPRISPAQSGAARSRALGRIAANSLVELALGLAIVGVVGLLGMVHPAIHFAQAQ